MHDFSAAGWIFCTVILYALLKKSPSGEEARDILCATIGTTLSLMRISLAGIVLFGAVRALAYKEYEWSEAAGDAQITLLIVKHVLLTFVFLIGVAYYRKAKKLLKNGDNE